MKNSWWKIIQETIVISDFLFYNTAIEKIHLIGTSNPQRIFQRDSGWCELLLNLTDEIILEKQTEV